MLDVTHLIESGGLLLITIIVFAESGLLLGFFLPGDTLLLAAGLFASQGKLPLLLLILLVIAAAMTGDNLGFLIGRRLGPKLFARKSSALFKREHLERVRDFYARHGRKTVMIGRFLPVVRTFGPVVAGAGDMPHRRFAAFEAIGAVTWGVGVPLIGYWLGSRIPNLDNYILPVIAAVVVIGFGPALYHILKSRVKR